MVNPEEVNTYIANADYVESLTDLERKKKLDILASVLLDDQKSLDECVVWARMLYEEYYVRRPLQLLHTFPLDAKVTLSLLAPFASSLCFLSLLSLLALFACSLCFLSLLALSVCSVLTPHRTVPDSPSGRARADRPSQ